MIPRIVQALLLSVACAAGVLAQEDPNRVEEKFNLQRLPWDNRFVWWLVGRWLNENPGGGAQLNDQTMPFGDVLDFGIGNFPMFGARSLNYTAQVFASGTQKLLHYEYGYMPVKNVTSRDRTAPNARLAFLSTSDKGYTLLEEGQTVNNALVQLSLVSFLKRSFDDSGLRIQNVNREFWSRGNKLFQKLTYNVNGVAGAITVTYKRQNGWPCDKACNFMQSQFGLRDACNVCFA